MRKIQLLAILAVAIFSYSVLGDGLTWVGLSAVYDVGNDAWYDCSSTFAPNDFDGHDFGDIGNSLVLGGECQSYDKSGDNAIMGWKITGGSDNSLNLPYLEDVDNNNKWQDLNGVNVADGLVNGNYTVEVWFYATDTDTNPDTIKYDSNGGNNYKATFTVTPEPGMMLGLALIGMVFLRRK